MAKEFYQLIRSFGGLSLEYSSISESDFAESSGTAYTPPERGDYRRITGSREIQLLSDAPGVIETFQTSASGDLFLPANTVADNTNDAGNGRLFFVKNSGTQDLGIKDYLGNSLQVMPADTVVIAVGNEANNWDIYFKADDIYFDNSILNWPISEDTVQKAIEYTYSNATGNIKPRFTLTLINNGTVSNNQWITFSELTPDVWIQFPLDCEIKEFTFDNSRSNTSFDLEFYKNSTVGAPYRTLSIVTTQYGYYSGWSDSFNAGDRLRIRYTDQGVNASDLVCVLYCVARV